MHLVYHRIRAQWMTMNAPILMMYGRAVAQLHVYRHIVDPFLLLD